MRLGPTGEYPQGKLNEEDEGAIAISITEYRNRVMIDFDTPIRWIALDKKSAVEFANSILKHTRRLK